MSAAAAFPIDECMKSQDAAARTYAEHLKALNRCPCVVVDIYDGDTLTVAFCMDDSRRVYEQSVRIFGIDTPEKRVSTKREESLRVLEKKCAGLSRAAVMKYFGCVKGEKLACPAYFELESNKTTYGRVVANVFRRGGSDGAESLSEYLLDAGVARLYTGEEKRTPWSLAELNGVRESGEALLRDSA
jgi:endonuclease YncB( thermonuclease family)